MQDRLYNSSKVELSKSVGSMIDFYNLERVRFNEAHKSSGSIGRDVVSGFVDPDEKKISWSVSLKDYVRKNKVVIHHESVLVESVYRPFSKQWLYFNRDLNERVSQMPRVFPVSDKGVGCAPLVVKGLSSSRENGVSSYMGGMPEKRLRDGATQESGERVSPRVGVMGKDKDTNLVICLSFGGQKGFSVLMTDCVPDLHMIGDTQCFPMFLYETEEGEE